MTGDEREVGLVLVALADPRRRELLAALVDRGSASATTLAGLLPVSRQAVLKHLEVLEKAGLVVSGRQGREVLYRVRREPLDASRKWLEDLGALWDRRLSAIKLAAEAVEETDSGGEGSAK